jgi:hypothetical protein
MNDSTPNKAQPPMNEDALSLALRFGSIFQREIQPEEIRYPTLARQAKALLDQNPLAYGQILESLLDGIPIQKTAKATRSKPDLVRFISRLHPEIREANRAHTVANLEQSLVQLSERLASESDLLPIKDVPRAIATTTEQLALLTGNATARLEIQNVPSRQKLIEMFKALQSKDSHV